MDSWHDTKQHKCLINSNRKFKLRLKIHRCFLCSSLFCLSFYFSCNLNADYEVLWKLRQPWNEKNELTSCNKWRKKTWDDYQQQKLQSLELNSHCHIFHQPPHPHPTGNIVKDNFTLKSVPNNYTTHET